MVRKFSRFIKVRFKEERGQSIIILAFAFLGLVAMLGLALDLGLVYIERVALKRAIDAAVLSGVIELPNEEDAALRSMEYLNLNGYDPDLTRIYFAGCRHVPGSSPIAVTDSQPGLTPETWEVYQEALVADDVRNSFWIDTISFRGEPGEDPDTNANCNATNSSFGAANKIRVKGQVKVDMNFMQFFGFGFVNVTEVGTAQNIDNLDVAVVFDRSGSMEFDPICYGCWERTEIASTHQGDSPRWSGFYDYPENGDAYPILFGNGAIAPANDPVLGDPRLAAVCDPNPDVEDSVYVDGNGTYNIIMEAELYGRNNSTAEAALRESGKGYWALQRGEGNYDNNPPYTPSQGFSLDSRGAHMAHHPSLLDNQGVPYGTHYTLAQAQIGDAPTLEYDFRFRNGGAINWTALSTNDKAYIWVRMHGGRGLDASDDANYYKDPNPTEAYWTVVYETDDGTLAMDDPNFNPNSVKPVKQITGDQTIYQIPDSESWRWVRLTTPAEALPIGFNTVYRLYIYAGSAGVSIDRVLVTNNTSTLPPVFNDPPNFSNPAALPQATAGSVSPSRSACDPCNPIFGQNISAPGSSATPYHLDDCTFFGFGEPVDNSQDPIFGEWESPMRAAKEAVKLFVTRLDPERDQIGFVSYSAGNATNSNPHPIQKSEMECLKRNGQLCPTPAFSYTKILKDIEEVRAGGGTNTGAGMKAGLEVMGVNVYGETGALGTQCGGGTCARSTAQSIMILMTDGVPNSNPEGACLSGGSTPWTGDIPNETDSQKDHNCPMYFAEQARLNNIRLYVIGLGYGVNQDYLRQVAQTGGGQAYFSASGGDLDLIFAEILNNIYVRLVE